MAKTSLKLLIDTNVIIPLEPTRSDHNQITAPSAAALHKLALETGAQLFTHPAAALDVERDADKERREIRRQSLAKYPVLTAPPSSSALEPLLARAPHASNDWVDQQLLAALYGDAVDYLVTEDRRLLRKARVLGVEDRVFTIAAAIAYLHGLFDHAPIPPPAVRSVKAYSLRVDDPIFESFRSDYGKEFDGWLQKCRREHRQTWLIDIAGRHAAFAIVNEELSSQERIAGKTLKICSFKVSDDFRGFRYGELLLKALFAYADENQYAWLFVTVFPWHEDLVSLFTDFGFRQVATLPSGETKLAKPMLSATDREPTLEPLQFHIRFGPRAVRVDGVAVYLVPIQPRYSDVLFPESAQTSSLFAGSFAFGNGLRKAYLCNAMIRTIARGDLLAFYRSQHDQGVIATGVVEKTLVSADPEEIARTVGKRTVYRLTEIEELASRRPVLALLFRQSRILEPRIGAKQLRAYGVVKSAPQSIVRAGEDGVEWLNSKIAG